MRLLGIDFGKKKVGIALSDENHRLAFPYKTLPNNKNLISEIVLICEKKEVGLVVIGKSQMFSGKDNPIMKDVDIFKKRFLKVSKIPIQMEAEFFTTQEASKTKENKKDIDASAAAIILQRFLEKNSFKITES
jgi:putative Holliday junction resolvase